MGDTDRNASAPFEPGHGSNTRAGTRLGPWELRELLGSGGTGEVWAAVRADGLHQGRAAVKLLRSGQFSPAVAALVQARFAREGELLARLTHPHIAQLLDAGLAADGTRYLVLEHVQGQRIDDWCDDRRLSTAARVKLLIQVCDAVQFAHANLIVHRDLKPANILITGDALNGHVNSGHVKLLDFGVAKLLEDTPEADELTRLGAAGLTPEYAAPEQINGDPVTVATDVYALGVLMFVLLSGQRPYGTPKSTAAQLARDIVEAEPRRLSAVPTAPSAPAAPRSDLRGDLEHIAAKALRKRPAERYASVQALADDLQRHLRHESVSAQAPTFGYLATKFVQRHKVFVAATGLVLAATVAGVAATLWQARLAREQAGIARAEAANANAIKDFLLGVFNTSAVGDGKTTQNSTASELLQRGGQRLLADTKLPAAVRLELLTVVGSLQNNLGLIDASDPLQREALRVAREVFGPQSEKYVYALVERGMALTQFGKQKESDELTREAVAIMEATGQRAVESYPVALYQLGFNAMQAGDLPAAVGYLRRSASAFEASQPTHAMRAIAHRWLGNALMAQDDFSAAEVQLRRSIEVSLQQKSLRDFGVGAGHYALGDLYLRAGRFREAEAELQQALPIAQTTLGPRHRVVALIGALLGLAQHELGQADAARATFASALDVAGSDASRQIGNAMDQTNVALGQAALTDGRADEALQRASAAATRWQTGSSAAWAIKLAQLAEAELLAGRHADALQRVQQALPLIEVKLGAAGLAARHGHVLLGEVLAQSAQRVDESRLAFATALAPAAADAAASSPTRTWLQARATVGLAGLALPEHPVEAQRLARAAIALIPPATEALRERLVLAQAHLIEGRSLAAAGQADAARPVLDAAVAALAATQAPQSPRLAQARLARGAVGP